MIVGGHATSSTIVLKHICNLPSMKFCADALMAKFCIRSCFLPAQYLLSLLHHHHTVYSSLVSLEKTHLLSNLPPTLKLRSPSAVKNHFESIREAGFAIFLQSNTQVLIQACRPVLGVDPILFLPASRVERGRLIRWRMGWLPGKPKECPCGSDHTSHRHLLDCPLVPMALFEQLPQPDQDQIHRIDFAITSLPLSSQELRSAYWIPLLTILWHIDVICNPDGDYSHETEHAAKWRADSAIEATTSPLLFHFASIQFYHQSIQNIASTIASIVKHDASTLPTTASIVKNFFPIVPAILSPIFTFSLPIAAISRSSPNMSQLLPANCMQSLPAELVTFLTSMQSQFNALNKLPSACRVAASQRLFSDKTGPDGFEYVYIPCSRRITHSEVRRSLRTLGVDTGHLLDINFPAHGVIGILVHVQYLEEFKSQLASAKVSLANNFDPLDPKNVADPKFANLSVFGLETQALVLQNACCLQALKFLRSHLSGWIGLEEIPVRPVAEHFGLWNANGLQPCAITDVLNHCQSLHMLFITETWLLSPARLLTSWSQFHLYGSPVAGNYHGSMGVSLLVSPSCPYAVTQIPMPNNYALAVKIGTL
ncbi:hypothetical protein PHYBLDRAFT_143773 [Phycomyces blakesleeanus NRRL 1555(-)]|uniref:Uncharacterized protein n=1 Tax=Phycomyces blakesleeanus (strain ATCC 8743b / DSM 1359 / FGSC 10004 / NBRC 33097 / NRRL 1555) TaxID=763407 RepID=A0A167NAS4_PHYB8|nr:hypothetical protein PHYBLDRAFT_143773 [Phycomyces blakesleeanus NRRL 1555(-)]OAD75520.1 hypothetical protein PHYBLDRAFT_143773 [Phycomyces blakesleeanus NRRL 1555(-)]|eukprot:XP_018293560.1 hypothetical protein PHYBLDRAFT_143773 [Phycomyces blakesleeanus NRRL 1555(-)]